MKQKPSKFKPLRKNNGWGPWQVPQSTLPTTYIPTVISKLSLTLCFWLLFTDERDVAFLYHWSTAGWGSSLLLKHHSFLFLVSFLRKQRAYRAIAQTWTATSCIAERHLNAHTRGLMIIRHHSQVLVCELMDGRRDGHDKANTRISASFHYELTEINIWNYNNILELQKSVNHVR
jgi:hypothetical protein